jgi:uncharacterized protein (TIRG00374 family)
MISTDPQAPAKGRRFFLGKLIISLLLLGALFWRVDRAAFFRSLQALPLTVFLGCLLLYILGYVLSTIRWQWLLRAEGIQLSLGRLLILYFEGAFFNLFLPTLIGGDIVRGYAIHKLTRGHDAAVPSILVDRLSGFAALLTIAAVAVTIGYDQVGDPQVALMVLGMTAAFVVLLLILMNARALRLAVGMARLCRFGRFQSKLQGWVDALQRYRRHGWALGQAFLLSLVLQLLIIVTYYVVGLALNLQVPASVFFVFVPLITTIAMLPVSVAGLGVRESGVVYFFAKVGVDAATALSMSLIWFSLTVIVCGLGGLAFLLDNHLAKRSEA